MSVTPYSFARSYDVSERPGYLLGLASPTSASDETPGLVIEMTDGTFEFNANFRERVGFYYDLVKANVQRIVVGLTFELRGHPVVPLAVTPGWLRSEKMLDNIGVTEETWRAALGERPGFGISESPRTWGGASGRGSPPM